MVGYRLRGQQQRRIGLRKSAVPCRLLAYASQGPQRARQDRTVQQKKEALTISRILTDVEERNKRQSNGLFRRREAERQDNSEVVLCWVGYWRMDGWTDGRGSTAGEGERTEMCSGKGCGLSSPGCDPIFWLGFAWVPCLRCLVLGCLSLWGGRGPWGIGKKKKKKRGSCLALVC